MKNDELETGVDDSSFLKCHENGLMLSDNDINVLLKHGINYQKYKSLSSLLFAIEEILYTNNSANDLEELSNKLGEYNYYNYTNK